MRDDPSMAWDVEWKHDEDSGNQQAIGNASYILLIRKS